MLISKRMAEISPSATLKISAAAKQMKAEGTDVISFGAGEPDFDTPIRIREAGKKALDEGFTKYTPSSGTKALKNAVCRKFRQDNALNFSADEILISCGAKHSLFNSIMTLCDDGDEVILPAPYWVSYPEMIKAAGGKPVIISASERNQFKVTAEQIKNAITKRTKLFILNSPNNPTGAVYTKEELNSISEIVLASGIYCISDEIYEKIIYDGKRHVSIASLGDEIKNKTIIINGVSKAYSMTGWRIGYSAGNSEIISVMGNLQSHSTSSPASVSQMAALEALSGDQQDVGFMVREFEKRRDYIIDCLNTIPGISCLKPSGAFYAFPSIAELFAQGLTGNSLSFAEELLKNANVAVVPGSAFGDDNCIRLSYATSMEMIGKGVDRIKKFCNYSGG